MTSSMKLHNTKVCVVMSVVQYRRRCVLWAGEMRAGCLAKSEKFKWFLYCDEIRWYLSFVIPMCEAAD